MTEPDPRPATRSRYQLLDLLRGIAILAMAVFHTGWDLYYFGWSSVDVTTDPGWTIFQKAILSSFLLLVGAGLVLGHGEGIRWRAFWRRWIFVVVAAALVTAGTLWMLPEYFVFFGVLHAIALFSLLGLLFLRLDTHLVLAIGIGWVMISFVWSDPAFIDRGLAWIGFWPTSPLTADIVPVFPWFGVVLIGMALMRFVRDSERMRRVLEWRSSAPPIRGLAFIGRWSLAVYLIHQPVILGICYLLMMVQPPVVAEAPPPPLLSTQAQTVRQSCLASCEATGSGAELCTRYCQCALEQIDAANLWDSATKSSLTPSETEQFGQIAQLCTAMSKAPVSQP